MRGFTLTDPGLLGSLVKKYLKLDTSFINPFTLNEIGNINLSNVEETPDGGLVVGANSRLYKLLPSGALDPSFYVGQFTNITQPHICVQPDGKLIVFGGNAFDGSTSYIRRLNADGTLDSSFQLYTGGIGGYFTDVVIQPYDGKIVAAGQFNSFNGNGSYQYIMRFNSNGTIDTTFTPPTFNSIIESVDVDSSGNIYVVGQFTSPNYGFVRLNREYGEYDTAYNSNVSNFYQNNTGSDGSNFQVRVQDDGKALVGRIRLSEFSTTPDSKQLTRFTTSGNVDYTFPTKFEGVGGVRHINLQNDGKILVAHFFARYNGDPEFALTRLNPDGTHDVQFQTPKDLSDVQRVFVQNDGKIIITGYFTKYGSSPAFKIARLLPKNKLRFGQWDNNNILKDITVDGGSISKIFPLPNGDIIITGQFSHYNDGFNNTTQMGGVPNPVVLIDGFGKYKAHFSLFNPAEKIILKDNSSVIIVTGRDVIEYNFVFNSSSTKYTVPPESNVQTINDVVKLDDGNLLIAGWPLGVTKLIPNIVNGVLINYVLDTSFNNPGVDGRINAIEVVGNKILAGGQFTTYGSQSAQNFIILNSDGSIYDATHTFTDDPVYSNPTVIDIQRIDSTRVVVAGRFATYKGVPGRRSLIQLNYNASTDNFDFGKGLLGSSGQEWGTSTLEQIVLYPQKTNDGEPIFFVVGDALAQSSRPTNVIGFMVFKGSDLAPEYDEYIFNRVDNLGRIGVTRDGEVLFVSQNPLDGSSRGRVDGILTSETADGQIGVRYPFDFYY